MLNRPWRGWFVHAEAQKWTKNDEKTPRSIRYLCIIREGNSVIMAAKME